MKRESKRGKYRYREREVKGKREEEEEDERVKRERYRESAIVDLSIARDGENLFFWAEKLENSFVSLANNGKNIFPIFLTELFSFKKVKNKVIRKNVV